MAYHESEILELIEKLDEDFVKVVIGFLNTRDGAILIWVSKDGKVVGVNNVNKTMDEIKNIMEEQINPTTNGLYKLSLKEEKGKKIIILDLFKGKHIYSISLIGRNPEGCFLREGTETCSMSIEQIGHRFNSIYLKNRKMVETESNQKELSFNILKTYYKEKGYHFREETYERNLDLFTRDRKHNYLAELMSDKNNVSLKVYKFEGEDITSLLIKEDDYGHQCLLFAIQQIINRLEAENIARSKKVGARRVDTRLIDMDCLKEAFINAIIHNDWSIKEPVIYIFSNRIEITSYGGLPDEQTKDTFYGSLVILRNVELMRILWDLNFAKRSGYGMYRILQHYNKNIFDIKDSRITVKFPYDPWVLESKTYV